MDFYITQHVVLAATALYHWPVGSLEDFRYWSFGAGLQYRFGDGGCDY
jgi:hypothetical protein